jgi:glycosyltransferase involved in cell wall biosynthesis
VATILFYSPFNQRSRDTESLMIAFKRQGHYILSLSQQEGFLINDFLKSKGIAAYSFVLAGPRSGLWYYIRHLIYLIRFCWRNKIDIVYSHLEPANFVAAIGQFFIRSKVFLCRHHIDEGLLYQFDKDLYYKITYKLARKIIVVSYHAKKYMVEKEGIPEKKILHINLAYDFDLYPMPELSNINAIKNQYPCSVLLVSACRLTTFKRPEISIQTLKILVDKGVDAKLILLGKGEQYDTLQKLISDLHLNERVSMPGFVSNTLEYMAASDFFLHPSLLDSSCVVVKEAGLVSKPVVVCGNIGDFEDYVTFGKNGFTVSQENFSEEAAAIIIKYQNDTAYLNEVGMNLHRDIVKLFSIENILPYYAPLNKPA